MTGWTLKIKHTKISKPNDDLAAQWNEADGINEGKCVKGNIFKAEIK